ncbi:hypothetical protein QAO71_15765 [Halopseudomonas sp. SMJS2]|uniref:hypothetical protein n=1 Tax=Halopseudomonas sp. SMJS2 TaxID=3041098 RepID=UPI002452FD82|nr:hypothetical protein [Halopseudomonas sp. SMJS2]WGK61482.1 hypothetical protein QAO71_15765 [Halopseudomonas sp. SMJS2]
MTMKAVRGKQARPTRSEIAAYYELLRSKAQKGDVQASAALIALAENKYTPITA